VKLEIVQAGNPVLRQRARPLNLAEISSSEIQDLIESMRKCMWEAPGVGLAAPQIGRSLQLAVIEDREEYHKDAPEAQLRERERRPVPFHVLINPILTPTVTPALTPTPTPKLAEAGGENVEFFEGCLSLSGFMAVVPRARSVRVECLDEHGEKKVIDATGWYARILQHEVDHLLGGLYIDRMQPRTFMTLDNWTQFCKGKAVSEITKSLGLQPEGSV
jgi:peptide deformylase